MAVLFLRRSHYYHTTWIPDHFSTWRRNTPAQRIEEPIKEAPAVNAYILVPRPRKQLKKMCWRSCDQTRRRDPRGTIVLRALTSEPVFPTLTTPMWAAYADNVGKRVCWRTSFFSLHWRRKYFKLLVFWRLSYYFLDFLLRGKDGQPLQVAVAERRRKCRTALSAVVA